MTDKIKWRERSSEWVLEDIYVWSEWVKGPTYVWKTVWWSGGIETHKTVQLLPLTCKSNIQIRLALRIQTFAPWAWWVLPARAQPDALAPPPPTSSPYIKALSIGKEADKFRCKQSNKICLNCRANWHTTYFLFWGSTKPWERLSLIFYDISSLILVILSAASSI